MAEAAWILTVYAGDGVSPYQPIAVDANGDIVGYTVRQRYLAVHLALLSVLPNHNANGSYSSLLDPATLQLFADVAGTTPSAQQVVVPLVAQMVAAANAHHAAGSAIVLDATETTPGVVTVTATKDGLPVPDVPIWPTSTVGVAALGSTGSQAELNAQLLGWPSLDYSTTRSGAAVTDADGQVTFSATGAALAAGVEFNTEEPPAGVHQYGDGLASQANLTWIAGEIRPHSAETFRLDLVLLGSQISSSTPAPGERLSDAVIVVGLINGVTATVEIELFDLTLDPAGSGAPLLHAQVAGLGNGTTPGLAAYDTSVAQAGHTLGYRHRAVALSDGSLLTPTEWSVLGIPSETGTVLDLVTAEVHLRKSVSADGVTWINAQTGSVPSYGPAAESADPLAGSFDDRAPDPGDGIPVYPAGADVGFRYELWLDGASTGVVTWPGAPAAVVRDDSGTTAEPADDFGPAYLDGDDGDGLLEPGEIWRYEAPAQRVAAAGESYRNLASVPAGDVHRPSNLAGPVEGTTTPRQDPAGYDVPALATSAAASTGGNRLSPAGGTVVDTVAYTNLVPGVMVTVNGELHARAGGAATPTGIIGATTFAPAAADGTVTVTFDVPAESPAGEYVVFEVLSVDGIPVASHADPDDAAQTVEVVTPSLTTAIANPVDGSQALPPEGGAMIDTVCYSDLYAPGATLRGELQVVAGDGSVSPSGITGSTAIAPVAPAGCANVTFDVPASGGVRYVAFEQLVVGGVVVAVHEDPTAVQQTFTQRSDLTVTTRTCAAAVVAPDGASAGATCDRISVVADPGDVVSGTSTAYPWVAGVRQCATPGAAVAWSVTVGADGTAEVETSMVDVPIGPDWEWVETASTPDGRRFARDCATAPRDAAESFEMRRGGGGGDHLPESGGNVRLPLMIAGWVVVAGAVLVAAPFVLRARRRRMAAALVAGCVVAAAVLVLTLAGGGPPTPSRAAPAASPAASPVASPTSVPSSPTVHDTVGSDPATTVTVAPAPSTTVVSPTSTASPSTIAVTTTAAAATPTTPVATAPVTPPPPATVPPVTSPKATTTTIGGARTTSFSFTVAEHHCFAPCTITVSAPAATKVVLYAPGGLLVGSGATGAVGTGGYGAWRVEVTAPAGGFGWTWTT
ncbi:MAG: VaFE repeat-containing surface-anchored protein [Ilumatobacter sp.]|nr:VaFE repeat-containing surface-anchored protein [Ilumatobacter sp.]MCB0984368.1 VaFE repeat-containing surface-anchored protein [Ilumatobacter sp.]